MNTEDYIIVNKKELEKELESLKVIKNNNYNIDDLNYDKQYIDAKIYCIESILSNSKPLTPLLEETFDAGNKYGRDAFESDMWGANQEDYLSFENFIKDKEL